MTVSYTHLEVYKRQAVGIAAIVGQSLGPEHRYREFAAAHRIDVYKRQFYDLVDDELHERVAEGLYGAGVHGAAHVAGRVPGEHPVQQVLGTCQLVGGDLVGEGDRAVCLLYTSRCV